MQCGNCGEEIVQGAEFCGNCGAKIMQNQNEANQGQPVASPAVNQTAQPQQLPTPPQPPQSAQPVQAPQPVPMPQQSIQPSAQQQAQVASSSVVAANTAVAVPKSEKQGLSIAGMILGIISIFTMLFFYLSIPIGVVGLVLSLIGKNKGGKSFAIAGIITSIVGILLGIGMIIFVLWTIKYCESNPFAEGCKEVNSSSLNTSHSVLPAVLFKKTNIY